MRVFIDDERNANGFDITIRSGKEFFRFLEEHKIKHLELISFDHDLGDVNEMTGYDIVKRLPDFLDSVGQVQFHTANPVGYENMLFYCKNMQKHGIMKFDVIVEERLDSLKF